MMRGLPEAPCLSYRPSTGFFAPLASPNSQRYERGLTITISNLPFEDWTSLLGSERLTIALPDRLTHHVNILSMNGDSYRLRHSTRRHRAAKQAEQNLVTKGVADPEAGEITTV